MKLKSAAELVEQKVSETLTYYAYPSTHFKDTADWATSTNRTPACFSPSSAAVSNDAGGEGHSARFD
jgi:hypothetical protein